jgi:hypothetical protein
VRSSDNPARSGRELVLQSFNETLAVPAESAWFTCWIGGQKRVQPSPRQPARRSDPSYARSSERLSPASDRGTLTAGAMSRTKETAPHAPSRESPGNRLSDEQLLARAAELVRRGWCQKALAEDRHGRQVEPWSGGATRWSPLGALLGVWHERGSEGLESFETAYTSLCLATGGRLEEWNAAPWRTQWHVLSAFTRARENLPEARRQVHSRAD